MNGQEHSFLYAGSGNFTMSGFWKQQQHLAAPNIECGVLFQGTDNMAGSYQAGITRKSSAISNRWKYIAYKTETIPPETILIMMKNSLKMTNKAALTVEG